MNPEEAERLLVDEYGRMAGVYDRDVAPHYAAIADRILGLANIGSGESLIDLGCGTGNVAFRSAGLVGDEGAVLGVDLAEGMIRIAQGKAAELPFRHLRFQTMDVRSLEIEEESFDAAVSCFGLPSIGYRGAFVEALRVLRPGGRFVSLDWAGPSAVGRALREATDRHAPVTPSEDVQRLRDARNVLRTAEDTEDRRDPSAILGILKGIGFHEAKTWTETLPTLFPTAEAYLRYSGTWRDSDLSLMDVRARAEIEREFRQAVGDRITSEGFLVPWELRFLFARK